MELPRAGTVGTGQFSVVAWRANPYRRLEPDAMRVRITLGWSHPVVARWLQAGILPVRSE